MTQSEILPGKPVGHNVFFRLKDQSDAAKTRLLDACQEFLSGHEGTIYFAAGLVAEDLDRPVNDLDWDIGLHVLFASRAAHDAYQVHPRHKQFIEQNQDNWEQVRVFDSYFARQV